MSQVHFFTFQGTAQINALQPLLAWTTRPIFIVMNSIVSLDKEISISPVLVV